jgi:hypothetical protein
MGKICKKLLYPFLSVILLAIKPSGKVKDTVAPLTSQPVKLLETLTVKG